MLDKSVLKLPENPEVQYHLGMIHYQLGNADAAKQRLTRALEIDSEFHGAEEAQRIVDELGRQISDRS
jgi:tetratricopeptide (TPR) repeat protein